MSRPIQLSELRGTYLTVYRVLWLTMLLLTVPAFVYYPYRSEQQLRARATIWYSAGLRGTGGNATVQRIAPFGDEARAKGIIPGEKLLAIDGKPIPFEDSAAATAMLDGPAGAPVRLTVEKEGGTARTVTMVRDPGNVIRAYRGSGLTYALRRSLAFWMNQATELAWLAVAILLFARRPQDPVAALLSLTIVTFCHGIQEFWPDAPPLLFTIIGSCTNAGILIAMLLFPSGSFTPRWTLAMLPAIAFTSALDLAGHWSEALATMATMLFYLMAAVVVVALIARYRATPAGMTRQQIKFALFGLVAAITWLLLSFVLNRWSSGAPDVGTGAWLLLASNVTGRLGNLSLAGGLLISLLRYRLYDADAVISRSAAYAFLTLLVGATFAGSEKVIEVLGEEFFGESMRAVSAGMGAAVAATLIAPLHNRVHRWTEHRFQKALAALRSDLPKLVGDMREFASLDHLLATIVARIERGVRASRAAVLLRDDSGLDLVRTQDIDEGAVTEWRRGWQPHGHAALECDRADPLFPIRVPLHADGAGTIGWILLGPRPDGSFYGKDEREALAEVADPIARAIHIVRQRDAREAALDRRLVALEANLPVKAAAAT